MIFRNYLVGTIFMVLLIFGPIDDTWTAWLAIRIGYLILIPLTVWLLLSWILNKWMPNDKTESLLIRILSVINSIALFPLAILEATSKTHIGNTQYIETRDGIEAVGDDILLPGRDWGSVLIILLFAGIVLWYGVIKLKIIAQK